MSQPAPQPSLPQPQIAKVSNMIGGAKFQQAVLDWSKQSNHLIFAVFGATLLLYATYAEQLPMTWRYQLSTTFGRTLLILLLYIVYIVAGWIPALLFAIGIAVTWSNRPLVKPINIKEEGFTPNIKVTQAVDHKWFVEKVLEECPTKIIEDRVSTRAVQDDSQNGNYRTSK